MSDKISDKVTDNKVLHNNFLGRCLVRAFDFFDFSFARNHNQKSELWRKLFFQILINIYIYINDNKKIWNLEYFCWTLYPISEEPGITAKDLSYHMYI